MNTHTFLSSKPWGTTLRLALIAFKHRYNAEWLVQKHGHITPAQARANLAQSVAVAA